jgi:hypothetical protein
MWEYRVSWTNRPSWWDLAWSNPRRLAPERRVDTYWVVDRRPDLGIKLRGGEAPLEIKVRYQRNDGWELWEKVIVQTWSPLESVRSAALLQIQPKFAADSTGPARGFEGLLIDAGLSWREYVVRKTRIQADAKSLLTDVPTLSIGRNCLAELVEFQVDQRHQRVWSLCFEWATPVPIAHTHPDGDAAVVCGYPELLSR